MDIEPLAHRTSPTKTAGARRNGDDGGFHGVMQLMAHLTAPGSDRLDDSRSPRTAERGAERRDRVEKSVPEDERSSRAEKTAVETTDRVRPQRDDRPPEAVPAASDGMSYQAEAPPVPSPDAAYEKSEKVPTDVSEKVPDMPEKAPDPTPIGVPVTATAGTTAEPSVRPAEQSPKPTPAATAEPVPAEQQPGVQKLAAETAAKPTAGSPDAEKQPAPVKAPEAPLAEAPAPGKPSGQEPGRPRDLVAESQARHASSGDTANRGLPRDVSVSIEPAPQSRGPASSAATLVQAHMAGTGGGAAAQTAPTQTASAQAAGSLHVGGGQPLHVGADSASANGQDADAGQNGAQNGGAQNGGAATQGGAGFAFGAATIGQRGFGGEAARAQFQEILAARTARAPTQGAGAAGTPSTLAFTAGPGGPQSALSTAMASRAEATAQGRPGALPSTAVGQVAVKLVSTAADGGGRVTIRLNPEELGKVDVKLELGRDGSVRALISAERPETLDLLQRDARHLEKALQEAGLKTDQGSLSFDLRGGDGHPADRGDGGDAVARGPAGMSAEPAGEAEDGEVQNVAGGMNADGSYDLVA